MINLLADLQAYHVFFFVDPNRANQTTLRDFFYARLFGKIGEPQPNNFFSITLLIIIGSGNWTTPIQYCFLFI